MTRLATSLLPTLVTAIGLLAGTTNAADIHVSATTGSDTNSGSQAAPLATIGAALAIAAPSDTVLVAEGTYVESVQLVSDVDLEGGYATDWLTRDPAVHVTVIEGGSTAVLGTSATSITVDGFRIDTAAGSFPGGSSYGVRLVDCADIVVTDCVIAPGNGADGSTPGPAPSGAPGVNGGGFPGGTGGEPTEPGQNGCCSGLGGAGGGVNQNGFPGTIGASGAIGHNGSGGSSFGTVGSAYNTSNGSSGVSGTPAQSGGGGGGGGGATLIFGPSGGNGGPGGGGGGAGPGGMGGGGAGGSFGVWIFNSQDIVVQSCTITTADGGNGGNGGSGGPGGPGGLGQSGVTVSGAGNGGPGAAGGTGGPGGGGGGGGGGPTVGIVADGGSTATVNQIGFTLGSGGGGGNGAVSGLRIECLGLTTGPDFDGSGLTDACESFVYNGTQATYFQTIADAIAAANDGDVIGATSQPFAAEPTIDFDGRAIELLAIDHLVQPTGGLYTLADDATLATTLGDIVLNGDLELPLGAHVDVLAPQVVIEATGSLTAFAGSIGDIQATGGLRNAGSMTILDGILGVTGGLHIDVSGTMTVAGTIQADVTNDNQATYIADSLVIGDYLNNGTTTVQDGTLTIFGALTDNGTIIGSVSGGVAAGQPAGMTVYGDYTAGAGAALIMPDAGLAVRVDSAFDVAIDDHTRYDMADAELRAIGLGGTTQTIERMSADVGNVAAGLDRTQPGHFPIGTLRVGPTPTTVDLVDVHDNDGLGQLDCEAVYVSHLVVSAGATLNTNGCPVYYHTADIAGTVDDPSNLIAIAAPCPADTDGNGAVDVDDLVAVILAWGTDGSANNSDVDGNGIVDVDDLVQVILQWGACGS